MRSHTRRQETEATKDMPRHLHGTLRGLDGVPTSPQFEGRFGRLFRTLPPARFDEEDLKSLAAAMIAEAEAKPTSEDANDDEENTGTPDDPGISAGFTYLGQFIDHDLTFDPASSLQKQDDPDALVDFRTPRFDLDCLYGRGPDDQPYLYEDDGVRMLLGRPLTGNPHDPKTRDVPRNSPAPGSPKRALIGDPRNDENVIVSLDPNVPNLTGFRGFPAQWAIEWNLFFALGPAPRHGKRRRQPAYKIDSSLVDPLGSLPPQVASQVSSLAERNLLRGLRMGLPSGQDVARRMGVPVIPDDRLRVGKATEEDAAANIHLVDISPKFRNKAPLWYYILAEAQQAFVNNQTPIRVGPVGGRIIGEVFVGLLLGDRHSFLNQAPLWQPIAEFTRDGEFGMAELIAQAMQA